MISLIKDVHFYEDISPLLDSTKTTFQSTIVPFSIPVDDSVITDVVEDSLPPLDVSVGSPTSSQQDPSASKGCQPLLEDHLGSDQLTLI